MRVWNPRPPALRWFVPWLCEVSVQREQKEPASVMMSSRKRQDAGRMVGSWVFSGDASSSVELLVTMECGEEMR